MADTGQDFTIYAGDSGELAFVIRGASSELLALGGTTASWSLASVYDPRIALITKTTDDDTEIKYTDAPNGALSVYLVEGDTDTLGGELYTHQLTIIDTLSGNPVHVSVGSVVVDYSVGVPVSPPPPPPPPP